MVLSNRQMSSEDSWRGRHGLTMQQTQTLYSFFRSLWSHLRGGPQLHREAVKSGQHTCRLGNAGSAGTLAPSH